MNRPKAKMVKYTPSEKNRIFDRYEYECVECGKHYIRRKYNDRINPYCADCNRKYSRERAKEQKEARELEHDKQVRRKLLEELQSSIYEMYSSNFYCIDDFCDQDMTCDDCMFRAINNLIKGMGE